MSLTLDHPQPGVDVLSEPPSTVIDRVWPAARILAIGGVASLAAGAIHVAAVAAHSEHRQAVWAFSGLAIVQLVWGAYALARPRRWLAAVGLVLGVATLGGWVLAKRNGIPFIEGLDVKEAVRFADALAAGLALVTALSGVAALLAQRIALPRAVTAVASVAILAVAGPGAVAAVDHPHQGQASGVDHVAAGHAPEKAKPVVVAAVPPRPFDPELPIDLGGVKGVTPEQQARAENLLAVTLKDLPQWADPAYAETKGFRSIGDGGLGEEHYINQKFMADDTILDPDEPESLVYDTEVTPKKLVAVMFMLAPGSGLEDAPDIGGALTQWHIHNNLCFTAEARVAGLTQGDGSCAAPLFKGPETPMIHVWIKPHPCGPFSALEGIAGGQIAEGETRACDTQHGSHGS